MLQQFHRMVFNVLAHNRDDHVKNLRLPDERSGRMGPLLAYDLVFAEGPGGEHTTSVAGEGKAPTRRHLLAVAASAGLESSDTAAVIEEVEAAVAGWKAVAQELEVGPSRRQMVDRFLAAARAKVRQDR